MLKGTSRFDNALRVGASVAYRNSRDRQTGGALSQQIADLLHARSPVNRRPNTMRPLRIAITAPHVVQPGQVVSLNAFGPAPAPRVAFATVLHNAGLGVAPSSGGGLSGIRRLLQGSGVAPTGAGLPSGAGTFDNPITLPEETVLPGAGPVKTWMLIAGGVLLFLLFMARR